MKLIIIRWQSTQALLMYLGPFVPYILLFQAKKQILLVTQWMLFYQMLEYVFNFFFCVHCHESFQVEKLLIAIRFTRLSLLSFDN